MFSSSSNSESDEELNSNDPNVQELKIFVSKATKKKSFKVMKFNKNLNVDFAKWKKANMHRENNQESVEPEIEEVPKFGEGSKYGSGKRKRFQVKEAYNPNEQPWVLKTSDGTRRDYRSQIEGGFSDNAAYYVLTGVEGGLEAHPVEEWYTFQSKKKLRTFTCEEVEEQFSKGKQYTNYSSLVERMRSNREAKDEEACKKKKNSRNDDESSDEECNRIRNRKGKGPAKRKKKGSDDEAFEESDDGDGEGREFDYVSSGDGDSEKEEFTIGGVAEEKAIRQALDSDEDDSSEEEVFHDGKSVQNGNPIPQSKSKNLSMGTLGQGGEKKHPKNKVEVPEKTVSDAKKEKPKDDSNQRSKKFKL